MNVFALDNKILNQWLCNEIFKNPFQVCNVFDQKYSTKQLYCKILLQLKIKEFYFNIFSNVIYY